MLGSVHSCKRRKKSKIKCLRFKNKIKLKKKKSKIVVLKLGCTLKSTGEFKENILNPESLLQIFLINQPL